MDGDGSTTYLIKYAANAPAGTTLYIGTETNLVNRLAARYAGEKTIKPLAVSVCDDMGKITVDNLAAKLSNLEDRHPGKRPGRYQSIRPARPGTHARGLLLTNPRATEKSMNNFRLQSDALVIGAGIAGSLAALTLADEGLDVILITAGNSLTSGNTRLAQGGIVYRSEEDDPRILEKDILTAGWKHNFTRAVRYLCRRGPEVLKDVFPGKIQNSLQPAPAGRTGT